jgi:amino acid transporter
LAIGIATRNFLAWSLDGLAPQKLSQVNPKFKTPIPALVVCGGLGLFFLFLTSYIPAFSIIVGVVGVFLTFAFASLSAVFYPFKRKADFEASPVNWRIGKIPVISLLGLLSILFLLCAEAAILLDPVSGISIFPSADEGTGKGVAFLMLLVNLVILASGFIVYWVTKIVQKKRGIDIQMAFKEIPIE